LLTITDTLQHGDEMIWKKFHIFQGCFVYVEGVCF
jgi:hypothetical protein